MAPRQLTEEELIGTCCGTAGCYYIFQVDQQGAEYTYAMASYGEEQAGNTSGLAVLKGKETFTNCLRSPLATQHDNTQHNTANKQQARRRAGAPLGRSITRWN